MMYEDHVVDLGPVARPVIETPSGRAYLQDRQRALMETLLMKGCTSAHIEVRREDGDTFFPVTRLICGYRPPTTLVVEFPEPSQIGRGGYDKVVAWTAGGKYYKITGGLLREFVMMCPVPIGPVRYDVWVREGRFTILNCHQTR